MEIITLFLLLFLICFISIDVASSHFIRIFSKQCWYVDVHLFIIIAVFFFFFVALRHVK